MDHILIRTLFHVSFFIGVSYFRKGKYLLFDSVVFCVAIVWFGGCTIRLQTDGLVFGGIYYTFRLCIIFCSLFTVHITLFLSLIDFRLKNYKFFKLICLNRKLGLMKSQIPGRRTGRHLHNAFGVIGFQLLSGILFFSWEENVSNVVYLKYDRLCAITLSWPTTIVCLQFSCWVQIFTMNFEVVAEKIRSTLTSVQCSDSRWTADCALSRLNDELKIVLRMKRAITKNYGSGIFLNQLYTFICILLNCTLLIHFEYVRRGDTSWYRYYFVARIIYYTALAYIPHWLGQIAFTEVKELISVIRKLILITDHNTFFQEKFLSISIGFAIIQLQFFMNYKF